MMKFVSSKTKSAKSSGDGVPTGDLMSSCDPRALPGGSGVASVSKEISKTVKKEKSFSSSRVTAIGNKLPSDYGSGISNRTKQKKLPIKSKFVTPKLLNKTIWDENVPESLEVEKSTQSSKNEDKLDILKDLKFFKPKVDKFKGKVQKKPSQTIMPVKTKPVMKKAVIPQKTMTKPITTNQAVINPTKPDTAKKFETNLVLTNPVLTNPVLTDPVLTNPVLTNPVLTNPVLAMPETVQSMPANEEPVTLSKTNMEVSATKPDLEKTVFTCEKCLKSFSYLKRFSAHQLKGNCDLKTFNCTQCGVKLVSAKCLKQHCITVHEKPLFKCAECSKIFPTEKTANKHFISDHIQHECKFCKKLFKNANTLRSHVYMCNVKKSDMVEKSTENNQNKETDLTKAEEIKKQQDKEIETDEVTVDKTNKTKKSDKQMDVDKDNKTGATGYKKECGLCKKIYYSRSGYIKHMKTHNMSDENNVINEMIIVADETILKAIEEMNHNNIILPDGPGPVELPFHHDEADQLYGVVENKTL